MSAVHDLVGSSLRGPHAHLARHRGRAVAYRPEVATFCAVPRDATADDWRDLAEMLGPGGLADMFDGPARPPANWHPVFELAGVRMGLGAHVELARASAVEVVELGESDVPDMLDLAERTRPGPFGPGTRRLGRYVGVREDGALLAMAGERLRPPGRTEISAVCTDPLARGRGLAAVVVGELVRGIRERGEQPFLHVVDGNLAARSLYDRLGFEVAGAVLFHGWRVPGSARQRPTGSSRV